MSFCPFKFGLKILTRLFLSKQESKGLKAAALIDVCGFVVSKENKVYKELFLKCIS